MSEPGNSEVKIGLSMSEKYKMLCEPAAATKRVIEYFTEDPFCDRETLKSATNLQFFREKFPEIIHLAGVVLDTRTKVRNVYSELSAASSLMQKKISTVLYESAQGSKPSAPRGVLEMGYLNNPFALVIIADRNDFKHLDARDIAGHYNKALQVSLKQKKFVVPFIAIQSGTSLSEKEILEHENRHAHNNAVRQSLERVDKAHLWGTKSDLYVSEANRITENLTRIWNENKQNPDRGGIIRSNQNWRVMMNYLLSHAKDEIIVRLMNNENTNDVVLRHGVYDLQDTIFHLNKNDGISAYFWNVYSGIVNNEIGVVRKSMDTYQTLGMKNKSELLPWMLQRVPIGSWKTELNNVGISSEVEIINKILKVKDGRWYRNHSMVINDKKLKNILAQQDELLVPQLVELLQELQN